MEMKKLGLKVALITVTALIAVASLAYIVARIAFPSSLASVYGNAGNYSRASQLLINAYDSRGNFDDITAACEYAVKSKNDTLIIKSVGKLIDDEKFSEYNITDNDSATFLTSRYVVALYGVEQDKAAVVDKAFSLLVGYPPHNQVEALIVKAYDENDKQTLAFIKERLNAIDASTLSAEQKTTYENDLYVIENALK